MTPLIRVVTSLVFLAVTTVAAQADDRNYPDRRLTPGDALPVTATDVCVPGYATNARRTNHPISRLDRIRVYTEYGVPNVRGENELDHLISLELGGSNRTSNLWPEPYHQQWGARVKDKLENRLHDLVCAPGTPEQQEARLVQAQREISTDWIAAYQKYGGRAFGTRSPRYKKSYNRESRESNTENQER